MGQPYKVTKSVHYHKSAPVLIWLQMLLGAKHQQPLTLPDRTQPVLIFQHKECSLHSYIRTQGTTCIEISAHRIHSVLTLQHKGHNLIFIHTLTGHYFNTKDITWYSYIHSQGITCIKISKHRSQHVLKYLHSGHNQHYHFSIQDTTCIHMSTHRTQPALIQE